MKGNIIKITIALICVFFNGTLSYAQDEEFHLDKTYTVNPSGKLWMNPEDAKVQIIGSERSDVRVKIDRFAEVKKKSRRNLDFKIEVSPKDGDLFIKEIQPSGSYYVSYGRVDYKILVELPEGVSLVVRSDDSNYEIKNVNGSIDVMLDDGDVVLNNCGGDRFDFNMDDGDVIMDKAKGELYAKLDDGNIKVYNADLENVNISSDDGRILLETQLTDSGSYQLEGDDSSIELVVLSGGGNIIVRGDDTSVRATSGFEEIESSESRHRYKLPGGSAKVSIRNDDGQVRISSPGS